jgi:hypothetical protein
MKVLVYFSTALLAIFATVHTGWAQTSGDPYYPSGLNTTTLTIGAGAAVCGDNPPTVYPFLAQTYPMSAGQTYYVYIRVDSASPCTVSVNSQVGAFAADVIPIAVVTTNGSSVITLITDDRTWFTPQPCVVSESAGPPSTVGRVTCQALGTNQNIVLAPSGTGQIIFNGGSAVSIQQSTAATSGSNVSSPLQVLGGNYWTSSASAADIWTWRDVLGTGSNPTSTLTLTHSGSTGAATLSAKTVVSGLNSVTFSTTPTFDASLGNTQKITLTGNVSSSTLSNASAGEQIMFITCQDSTGNRTFAWPSNVKGGMTIGSTASKCSTQGFIYDGTNAYALSPGVANQ